MRGALMRGAWRPLAVVAALLVLLTYFLRESRSSDLGLSARIHETLQGYALHDAELTREAVLARAGLLAHYDSLAQAGRNLTRDLAALRGEAASAADAGARRLLTQRFAALDATTQSKLSVADDFKSDNALLRNSLAYLTHAQAVLGSRLDRERTLAEEMRQLSHALLDFLQTSDAEVAAEIHTVLDRLAAATAIDGEFQLLVTHGRLIVNILPQVDASLRQLIEAPTAPRARALQDAVWEYSGRVEARAQVFRILLYLAAVTLLGYLIHQFLRLRTAARELRASNIGLQQEMAERREAEDALRASEERLRAITDSAHEAIVTADAAGRMVSFNAGATAVFGHAANEMMGAPFIALVPARHRGAHERAFIEWAAGRLPPQTGVVEFTGMRKGGDEFPLEASLATWSARGERYVTAIMRDVSERKRLEEVARQQELQLIQANKMTALGTLVSGVAHEINNPNQLVLLNAGVLAEAWSDALGILDDYRDRDGDFSLGGLPYVEMRATVPTLIHDIHDGALRIERIVNELKDFARPRAAGTHAAFDLNEAVGRAARLLAHVVGKRTARFTLALAAGLPPLRGDAQQIEQVVVNLLVNALEALPDREHGVTVSTCIGDEGRSVTLEVHDEGEGIAPEHLARLCDPFFTTKQASGGTGLGLAITASLLRAHGARLEFFSEVNRGTRAVVSFPIASEAEPLAPAASEQATA